MSAVRPMKCTFLLTLLLASLPLLAAVICASPPNSVHVPTKTAGDTTVEVWLTTGDGSTKLLRQSDVSFSPDSGSNSLQIRIDEGTTYQQVDGFGAALTDSAAWLISSTLDVTQTYTLLNKLFSPREGIGISYVRLPIGASDFVKSTHYTYDDMPPGLTDTDLISFSIAHDQAYIIPILQQAKSINTQLKVMGSPWSAPAWMKSPETLYGGSLKSDNSQTYADYFVKFIQAYQAEGIPIDTVTVQNEPHHTDGSYPTMRMEWSEQASFVRDHLGPAFDSANIDAKILIWDHNWDEPDYPLEVLGDTNARRFIVGSAWHCYKGTPDVQTVVHNAHPDKDIYFSECTGGEWDTDFASVLVWNFQNLFIGATRHWAKTVLLWNLALDEHNGPHNGGCDNCRGVATIRQDGKVDYNVEYYVIGHLSKFVDPGACRIKSDHFPDTLESVAFQNADGSIVLVVLNPSATPITFDVEWSDHHFSYSLPMQSVATFRWGMHRVYLSIVLKPFPPILPKSEVLSVLVHGSEDCPLLES
jgi:O-glycosyl hydrolase